ncbi:hypothetical protein B0H66DRAFT_479690 [Apodospora peruviana]|uniref:Fe2OG dioxygenase domain-containing protein n=1 Tax=Apodospora peruviana TaxID=516989 RepID=A0AAE0I2K4_9PEZI|nr:hypothetical protein B0H66DRAFT_479690 [Apodospora peruviana]
MFSINPAAIPAVATRKALIIIDLQNDFVGDPDAVLPVTDPEGFVSRTLKLVNAFRDSGAGDVIWVRSEFERHRALTAEGEQIILSDMPPRPTRPVSSRGRQPMSWSHDGPVMEADDEAFLSVADDKPTCVRKGTAGAKFPARVQEAIDESRDIIFTKTHYSAFASAQQQLVQLLRGRFVTQMFVCGALTNVGIYATALDAGRHGYEMTIVEDCCGYRGEMRHLNAVRQLMQLVGSEVMNADLVIDELLPPKPKETPKPTPRNTTDRRVRGAGMGTEAGATGSASGSGNGGGASSQKSPPELQGRSSPTGLSPSMSKVSLSGPPATPSPAQQPAEQHVSATNPQQDKAEGELESESAGPSRPVQAPPAFWVDDSAPLEADSDPDSDFSSPETAEITYESLRRGAVRAPTKRLAALGPEAKALKGPQPRRQPRIPAAPAASCSTPGAELDKSTKPKPRAKGSGSDKSSSGSTESSSSDKAKVASPQIPTTSPDTQSTPSNIMAETTAPIVSEPLCEGDTHIISNALPPSLAAPSTFDRLLSEVSWAGMSRMGGEVPRRIAVQGLLDFDGTMPVYRHPADESPPLLPFSPTVLAIKTEIEKHLGHPLNHVLIQHYRTGNDYISEHSDKTLDIVKGSYIANVSLGAERTMVFRTKRPPKKGESEENDGANATEKAARQIQRAALPHNSLCRMGLKTNMRWLHAIRQDKRSDRDKTPAELAFGGARISLTFRHIGTYLDSTQSRIWGQGATSKSEADAKPVVNGQTPEAVKLLQAFGAENHSSDFDWDAKYGEGSDVLHLGTPKRFCAGFDEIANMRVALALAELGLSCAKGSVEGRDVRFEDNDPGRAVIDGHENVLRYLDAVYGAGRRYDQLPASDIAKRFTRLHKAFDLRRIWRAAFEGGSAKEAQDALTAALAEFKEYAREEAIAADKGKKVRTGAFFIAGGDQPSPADFALWPVLYRIVSVAGGYEGYAGYLSRYYGEFRSRSAVEKVSRGYCINPGPEYAEGLARSRQLLELYKDVQFEEVSLPNS